MSQDLPASPAGGHRTAIDLIDRYRAEFGAAGEGLQTAHAGTMWHIIALAHMILGDLQKLLSDSQCSAADMFVLAVLLIENKRLLRPSEVAAALSVTPAAISIRLAKLERLELVIKRSDTSDRRIVLLELTEAGKVLVRAFLARVGTEGHFARAEMKLGAENRKQLEEMLVRLGREMSRNTPGG